MSESQLLFVGDECGPNKDAALDVVFVHGITGDAKNTWTSSGGFWPRWLAEDHQDINVYSVGYNSAVWADILKGNQATLRDRATTVAQYLATRDSRGRPIIFVTHSMGGLIVKKLLRLCNEASSAQMKRVANECVGVAFIATPHGGANIAATLSSIASLATTETIKELKKNSEELVELGIWFSEWSPQRSLEVLAFYETTKYNGILVVDKVSANPNVVGCFPVAIELDHVEISKAADRKSLIYLSVSQCIENRVASILANAPGGGGDGSEEDLSAEFKVLSEMAPHDRQTLAEKLESGLRSHEIKIAEARKEAFNMAVRKNIASPSAVARYVRLMSSVKSRFDRHVGLAVAHGKSTGEVDAVIQAQVVDSTVMSQHLLGEPTTSLQVEGAMYYLGGNCHIRWN